MEKGKQGKGSIILVLAFFILFSSTTLLAFKPEEIGEKLSGIAMTMEDGLEVISTKSYQICSNVKWSNIKTAGVKFTETSIDGFLQVCERLALDFGKLKVYADFECRLLWVYSEADNSEVYYVQFK